MKRSSLLTLMLLLFGMLPFQACDPDEDTATDTEIREKYLGTWRVQEDDNKKVTYEVGITADPFNTAQVYISNFYNVGIQPYAIVTAGTITIPLQSFGRSVQVSGTGSYNNEKINWVYYVNDGADLDTISSTYTKL